MSPHTLLRFEGLHGLQSNKNNSVSASKAQRKNAVSICPVFYLPVGLQSVPLPVLILRSWECHLPYLQTGQNWISPSDFHGFTWPLKMLSWTRNGKQRENSEFRIECIWMSQHVSSYIAIHSNSEILYKL